MPKVFIGVGSNLGDRAQHLKFAKKELLSIADVTDFRCSPVYETEPVAAEGGPFLNAVWSFQADLSPQDLLKRIQEVEVKAGRKRSAGIPVGKGLVSFPHVFSGNPEPGSPTEAFGDDGVTKNARTLDLDILFYGDRVIQEPGITVPHPRLHERAFVLEPFCDLAPEFIHPVIKKTMKELLSDLSARSKAQSAKLIA